MRVRLVWINEYVDYLAMRLCEVSSLQGFSGFSTRRGWPYQRESSDRLGVTDFSVTPRTVTELVDGLERDGLVQRRDDPSDRRAKLVFLTNTGRRVNGLAMAARRDTIAEIFAGLSASQRDVLGQVLTSINDRVTAITAANDEAPDAALPPTFTGD